MFGRARGPCASSHLTEFVVSLARPSIKPVPPTPAVAWLPFWVPLVIWVAYAQGAPGYTALWEDKPLLMCVADGWELIFF
jgi:hypothetical protein